MFGFPIGNGNSGYNDFLEKFTNNADSGFPKSQQREVFYSVKDGVWDDITTWQTASGRVGKIPSTFDDVYVRHIVSLNANWTINNLYISGRMFPVAGNRTYNINGNMFVSSGGAFDNNTNNGINLNVLGDFNCFGSFTINNLSNVLRLYGQNNYIENLKFTSSVGSIVSYERLGSQQILDLNYGGLSILGLGTKTLSANAYIQGALTVQGGNDDLVFELGGYDFTVLGATTIFRGSIRRSSSNPILFVGLVTLSSNNANSRPFILPDNCSVEFRGGITTGSNIAVNILGSTGIFYFTTNNQTITGGASAPIFIDNPIIIGSGVTLSITPSMTLNLNNTINGTDATSSLINRATINFATQNSAENSLTTGIWDFTTNANTIGYTGNYSATIPSRFPTFHNLTIRGTGTKTLGVNTTLNGNLTSNGNLDCGIYNLTVTGTSTLANAPGVLYPLQKTGAGSIIFIGQVIGSASNMMDFTVGNPTVQFRGGMSLTNVQGTRVKSGTGTWSFTTNNQSVITNTGGADNVTFDCPVVIASGITLTLIGNNPAQNRQTLNFNHPSSINGADGTSTLISYSTLTLNGGDTIMTTGIFNPALNTISAITYNYNGAFSLPYSSYASLNVNGTGKTLGSNTIVYGNLSTGSNTEFDLLSYDLTVYGTTSPGYSSTLYSMKKTGPGNLLFIGSLNLHGPGPTSYSYDFSGGNPNVELRGGISMVNAVFLKTGTGTWSFTTNNQALFNIFGGSNQSTFDCTINIASNIVLTIYKTAGGGNINLTFNGQINGGNAASSFVMGTLNAGTLTCTYNNAIQPMVTGILDTGTNLNTWIYGLNNQDIKGSPTISPKQVYRNLRFSGSGTTKTLQGFVSVLNTYTLDAGVTVNNNGYTLTNP